ncbi:hypothetical protein HYR65_04245 [Candidatus Azambacteria bacterium]|nr:hypothetical protein [Candidatus Azambacteria bacterium]
MFSRRSIIFTILFFAGFSLFTVALAAWVDAPAAPPGYGALDPNSFKPVNLSDTAQTKAGDLGAGRFCLAGVCYSDWASVVSGSGGGYWISNGNDIYNSNSGYVGIGAIPSSTEKLEVAGNVRGDAFIDNQSYPTYYIDPAGAINSGNLRGTLTVGGLKVCLESGLNCPSPAASDWTLSGSNLYPNSTTYNVGIGTTGYTNAKLGVNGEVTAALGTYGQFRAVNGSYGAFIRNDGSDTYIPLLTAANDQYGIWNSLRPMRVNNASGDVYLGSGATAGLYVQHSTGNVGIGTTGPRSKLDIATAGSENSIFGLDRLVGLNDLRFYTDDAGTTERMRLSSTGGLSLGSGYVGTNPGAGNAIIEGNVGIGTTENSAIALYVGSGGGATGGITVSGTGLLTGISATGSNFGVTGYSNAIGGYSLYGNTFSGAYAYPLALSDANPGGTGGSAGLRFRIVHGVSGANCASYNSAWITVAQDYHAAHSDGNNYHILCMDAF